MLKKLILTYLGLIWLMFFTAIISILVFAFTGASPDSDFAKGLDFFVKLFFGIVPIPTLLLTIGYMVHKKYEKDDHEE